MTTSVSSPSRKLSPGGNGLTTTSTRSRTDLPTFKLHSNHKEREMHDHLADLFSIIKTTEQLERAYMRDTITATEYEKACAKLITQFKTALNLVQDYTDLDTFVKEYKINCKAGLRRLSVGVPGTVETPVPVSGGASAKGKGIAEVTQHFITTMDNIKLNLIAVDEIQPYLVDLLSSMGKLGLRPDFEGFAKVKQWLSVLNTMKASDELDEEQVRQLLFDLESSYSAFHKAL